MTPERAAELWPVMKAYSEGKEVEYKIGSSAWAQDSENDFDPDLEWRVKPEPRELWVYPEEFEKDRNPILAYVTPISIRSTIKFREVTE